MVQTAKKISILFTVSPRQRFPKCSNCSRDKCPCFRSYVSVTKRLHASQPNQDEEISFYWDSEEHKSNFLHYQDHLPRALHIEFHGHNFEKFYYPIERNDKNFVDNFNQRYENNVTIPKMLIPIYDANLLCKHGSKFNKW